MKKIIFFFIFVIMIPYVLSINEVLCFQEWANVSTVCGGLNTGSYNATPSLADWPKIIDGDYGTFGYSNSDWQAIFINYSKPNGSTNYSIWNLKTQHLDINFTFPKTCWDYSEDYIFVKLHSYINEKHKIDCLHGGDPLAYTVMIGETVGKELYEEAMFWDMNVTNEEIPENPMYGDYEDYFDLWDFYAFELTGTVWLAVIVGLFIIFIICSKINFPFQMTLLVSTLWLSVVAAITLHMFIWALVVLEVGTLYYWIISSKLRRG